MERTKSLPKAETLNDVVPHDVWLEIATLSEPPALLALGMTCRGLHELFNTTDVWSPALRAVCRQRNISEASYPVHLMSVAEMQRAAMAPYRVENMLVANTKRTGVETAYELDQQNASAAYPMASMGVVDISLTHLVPGGRLFVVAERDGVSVWDIGITGSPVLASPLCVIRIPYSVAQGGVATEVKKPIRLDVQSGPGKQLKVAVIWSVVAGAQYRIAVFDIFMDLPAPTFNLLATVEMELSSDFSKDDVGFDLQIRGNIILIVTRTRRGMGGIGQELVMWNYKTMRYALAPENWIDESDTKPCVLLCGSQVLKVGERAVAIWDSPNRSRNTSPCSSCIRLVSQMNHPRVQPSARIIPYPSPPPPDRDRLISLPRWRQQSAGHTSVTFDVFLDTHRDPTRFPVEVSRYRVDIHCAAGELVECTLNAESQPLPLPLPKRISPMMRRISTSPLMSFRAEGHYGAKIICATYALLSDSVSVMPAFMSVDYTSWVALCAVSGRAIRKSDSHLLVVDLLM